MREFDNLITKVAEAKVACREKADELEWYEHALRSGREVYVQAFLKLQSVDPVLIAATKTKMDMDKTIKASRELEPSSPPKPKPRAARTVTARNKISKTLGMVEEIVNEHIKIGSKINASIVFEKACELPQYTTCSKNRDSMKTLLANLFAFSTLKKIRRGVYVVDPNKPRPALDDIAAAIEERRTVRQKELAEQRAAEKRLQDVDKSKS